MTKIDSPNEIWSNGGGCYANLPESDTCDDAVVVVRCEQLPRVTRRLWWVFCWWGIVVVVVFIGLLAVAFVCVFWIVPVLLRKVVVPALHWVRITFSRTVLALLIFTSIAIFPVLCIPSSPSMWIAGITFGYGYGFLLTMTAISFGMSLPFMIGCFFHQRIHLWLEKWPEKAEIIRLAGEGNCFHQFHAIALLRISPFPYIVLNYAAVATNTKYYPYIFGSVVGEIPDIFLTMYSIYHESGILISKLADASTGSGSFSLEEIIYDGLGFLAALAATVAVTIYAKRSLQRMQNEGELL